MSAPFAPGDVVQCIRDDFTPSTAGMHAELPKRGACYRVLAIYPRGTTVNGLRYKEDLVAVTGLNPGPFPGYTTAAFRKIDDEVEESFRLMLRSLKPKIPPVPASSPAGFLVPRSVAAHISGEG